MSVAVVIDSATPLLERVRTAAQATGLALVGARAVGTQVKDHLYALDASRHRYGNHFYRQAGDSVTTGVSDRGGYVSITQVGFRQRLQGGTIRAKNVTYLTIPAAPEAYAHRAREFSDLEFSIVYDPEHDAMRPALVRRVSQAITFRRRKQHDGSYKLTVKPGELRGGEVMYWLVRSVTQQPDPSVLPRPQDMSKVAVDAIAARLLRVRPTPNGGAS